MKRKKPLDRNFGIPSPTASILSACAAAALVLVASAQAQPTISNLYPDGKYLLEPAPALTFTASSPAGITNVSVQLTLTNASTRLSYVRTLTSAYGLTVSGPNTAASVSAPLITNAFYSAVIQLTDANDDTVSQRLVFDTLSGYVFEAEDYDYTANGQTGQFFDNPQTNAYANLGATAGVDCWNASSGGSASYRPNPNPQTSEGPGGLATEPNGDTKRLPYDGTGKTDYDIGWTAGGHFGNYTRHYPAGTYNLYMRASQPNVSLQSDAASVTVTKGTASISGSGPHQFSIPNTGGWQNYTYVPLIDSSSGSPAQITFDGTASTLTVTVDGGNLNENFFILIPAETTIPVSSVTFPMTYPDGLALYQATNTFTFGATSSDVISPGDISVIVTATNLWQQGSVTTLTINQGLTVTDNSGGAKTDWLGTLPLSSNTIYSVYIQVFDKAGIPASTTIKFDTIDPQTYTFEAEDYNYTDSNGNPGLYVDNPQTNSYQAAFATEGIDDHVTSTGGNNAYARAPYPAGPPNCLSIENCGDQMRDAYNGTGYANYDLGNATSGNWANYTRNFPTGTFNIYLRAASANGSTTDSASLAQVLSDPAKPNQTVATLGTFSVPNTGGCQSYQWVPLMDQFGKLARVSGGFGTFRLTTDKGGYNADFLLLAPAQPGLNSPPYANAFAPDGTSALYQYTNKCSFLVHSSVGISANNISVAMDGVAISGLTFSGTPNLLSVTAPVSVNGYHTATVIMTDSVGTTTNIFQFNTFDPAKSYLFEAEDFNYTDGSGNPGQYFDDPNTVNQYAGLPATQGIDAYSVPGNLGASLGYRGGGSSGTVNNGLNCENANDSLETAAHAGLQNYDLGNTANGNWGNYTRTYPAGTYNIYMRAANGNGGASARGSAALVTSGASTANQTLSPIGSFDPVPPTGGWQIYTWVACKDKNGNLGQVTLSGAQSTLRITSGGGYNADYFVLVPVNTTLPAVANLYPNGLFQAQGTNTLSFDAISSAGISTNSIVVTLNGVNLTNLGITGSSTDWHVSYSGLQPNTFYTVTIAFANLAGAPYTTAFNFDTYSFSNYQWEAEDWDYTSNSDAGLFFDDQQVDKYFGLASTAGIDAGQITYNTSIPWVYRPYDPNNLTPGTDINDDIPRVQFGTNADYRVNWFGYGSWANYTRHYPKGTYYVIGRFTEGGADTVAILSKVTSGWGTGSQSLTQLGLFFIPLKGWDSWESVYLTDLNSNRVTVTFDGSQTTLRLSGNPVQAGDPTINAGYFMLVPAEQPTTLTASLSGGKVTVSFPTVSGSSYQVQYKNRLSDTTWTALGSPFPGTGSIVSIQDTPSGASRFYRVQIQ